MKLQINTTEKTIKIEESVNLRDLIRELDKLFPHNTWKEYTLEYYVVTQPVLTYPDLGDPYPIIYPYYVFNPINTYDTN